MSAARPPSYSGLVASPLIALKRRSAHATRTMATAAEPLERRLCLSVSFSGPVNWPTGDSPRDIAVGDFNTATC